MRIHLERDTRSARKRAWNWHRYKRQGKGQQFAFYQNSRLCCRSAAKEPTRRDGPSRQTARIATGSSGEEMMLAEQATEAPRPSLESCSTVRSTRRLRSACGGSTNYDNDKGRSTSGAAEAARSRL